MTGASKEETDKILAILDADLARKSPRTRTRYKHFAKIFLFKYNDFSRQGAIAFVNHISQHSSKNTTRLAYAALAYLYKALSMKFPLDSRDAPSTPTEDEMDIPLMPNEDVVKMIKFWRRKPGDILTAFLFISTIYGVRAGELSDIEIRENSVVVSVEKQKKKVRKEHLIPDGTSQFLLGYKQTSRREIKEGTFKKLCDEADVTKPKKGAFHCIRRALDTSLLENGINDVIIEQFMNWALRKTSMVSRYAHLEMSEVDEMVFKKHPFLPYWLGKE